MHALALGLGVRSGRASAVHWLAWDVDWQGDLDKVNVVLPSFSPPPSGR